MAISLSDNFIGAFLRADARPRFWVEIDNGTTQWVAMSGSMDPDSDLFAVPEGVVSVSSIGAEVDVITREVTIGEVVVTLEDAFLRPILVANRIRGQKLTVKLGAAELDEADFATYFTGTIEEITPDGIGNVVEVTASDLFAILQNTEITHTVFNKHPLEHIKLALNEAGIPDALIETADFDPSDARYTGSISHYVISKNANLYEPGGGPIDSPLPAYDIITQIGQLLIGQLVARETGKIGYVVYDPTASAIADWGTDEILPDTVEQSEDPFDNLVNSIKMRFWLDFDEKQVWTWVRQDATSLANYAYPGTSQRAVWREVVTSWINAWCRFTNSTGGAIVAPTDTTIKAQGGLLHGFCGTNGSASSGGGGVGAPPAWATVSASRPLYLYIRDVDRRSLNVPEVVKCTSLVLPTSVGFGIGTEKQMPSSGTGYSEQIFSLLTEVSFQSLTRGFEGSGYTPGTGNTWGANYALSGGAIGACIWDVTILYDLAEKLLERFSDGFYKLELETDFSQFGVQLGDVVTVTWPGFVGFGLDGLDNTTTWEVVGREPDAFAAPPRIKWTLASILTSTPSTQSLSFDKWSRAQKDGAFTENELAFASFVNNRTTDATAANSRTTDFEVTDSGGLTIDIAAGIASDGRRNTAENIDPIIGYAVEASRDNYIFVDVRSGQVINRAVSLGGTAPLSFPGEAQLALVKTGASSITSITDLRLTGTMSGDRLRPKTLKTLQQFDASYQRNQNFDFSQFSKG